MMRWLSIAPLFVLMLSGMQSAAFAGDEALDLINTLRSSAGMTRLVYSPVLSLAAKNHATYLSLNIGGNRLHVDAHIEQNGRRGFTGESSDERAEYVGYAHSEVKENVSIGNTDIVDSVTGLMAGIYHRFTFLDFQVDEMGYGREGEAFVYELGRSDLARMCTTFPKKAELDPPFDCLGTLVKSSYIEGVCKKLPAEAVYQPPYRTRCPGGKLLRADYMERFCKSPLKSALYTGKGSYYKICKPEVRVKSGWLEHLCTAPDSPARYVGENRYYQICANNTKVFADWFKQLCENVPAQARYEDSGYYIQPCHSDFKARQEYLNKLDAKMYRSNPRYVVWPPKNSDDIPPAFFDESPDPLPDLDVSGYPLSLQFNPGKVKSVHLDSFILEKKNRNGIWERVKAIRELNRESDPNQVLSKWQFAWFPLKRLDWGTYYRASVNALIDKRKTRIQWHFRTQALDTPLYILKREHRNVKVYPDRWVALYFEPDKTSSRPLEYIETRWVGNANVETNILDLNTLQIYLGNTNCKPVSLYLAHGREVKLTTCD
ncbi:MAG: hypothetical protein DSZ33_03750 [Gammaproteobacteria bacterium]|nr:MAG: hypothetical protein DSZ33_03750 [Gammaproteobacteria bacterium]